MKVVVGITGASGAVYAHRLLLALCASDEVREIFVIFSSSGKEVWDYELGSVEVPTSSKLRILDNGSFFESIASGSNCADAMVILPCTMGSAGRIASGVSSTLIERAADVQLKEGKPLIMAVRETPLSFIHLKNLTTLSQAGAVIMPISPQFYTLPTTIEELVEAYVERVMEKIQLKFEKKYRWIEKKS